MVKTASFRTFQSKLLSIMISTAQEANVKVIFSPVLPAWYTSLSLSVGAPAGAVSEPAEWRDMKGRSESPLFKVNT